MSRPPVPGPRIRSSLVFLVKRTYDPLQFFTKMAREYGDLVHLKVGSPDIFLLNDPVQIKQILVTDHHKFTKGQGLHKAKVLLGDGLLTSEGDLHRNQRRLVQPAFHHARIAGYASTMVDYAQRMAASWRGDSTLDISEQMTRLTLAIVAKTLFDADVESEAAEVGRALTTTMKLFPRYLIPYSNLLEKLPLPSNRRFREAKTYLDSTIFKMIQDRRSTGSDKGDLLSMLLLARDEEGGGRRMTDAQVRDEAMTLFLAGHETTSNALTWTWYLLASNPHAEQALHDEVDSVLGARSATIEDVPRLKYTEMVLAESMRLFPPAWVIGRRNVVDYVVNGYTVPQYSLILMSPWVVHRDPRYFAEPLQFDPGRWTSESKDRRPKFSYFPFGGGPRVCIGESFAWTEGVLVLATIAQRWKLRLAPGHRVQPQALVTLRPRYGMKMIAESRAGK
jgi:cytochrome P450